MSFDFDICKQCEAAFSTHSSSVDDRTPIQGTCQCRKNICRACVIKLHLEQSDGSNDVVFCPDCKQSAFQIENLIVNEMLCAAIPFIRSLRDNNAIDVDASGTELVKKLRRSARIAVPVAQIKIENASKGFFKCPKECRNSIPTSEAGCNVITCKGHSGFRSKDNPYNHPGFIHFCVHCKVVCADNFSVCQCPKRKDAATRKRVLDETNERNRNNPIDLSPERPSEKKRKEDKKVGANIDLDTSCTPDNTAFEENRKRQVFHLFDIFNLAHHGRIPSPPRIDNAPLDSKQSLTLRMPSQLDKLILELLEDSNPCPLI